MNVRKAEEQDNLGVFESLKELNIGHNVFTKEYCDRLLRKTYVVENEGKILGAAVLNRNTSSTEIYAMACKVQGCGAGRALMEFIENLAIKDGAKRIFAYSLARYEKKEFYHHFGFETTSGDGTGCYTFTKMLV
jgi:N-acetylglutamate synthase-like GNAT family acetyltransferase